MILDAYGKIWHNPKERYVEPGPELVDMWAKALAKELEKPCPLFAPLLIINGQEHLGFGFGETIQIRDDLTEGS